MLKLGVFFCVFTPALLKRFVIVVKLFRKFALLPLAYWNIFNFFFSISSNFTKTEAIVASESGSESAIPGPVQHIARTTNQWDSAAFQSFAELNNERVQRGERSSTFWRQSKSAGHWHRAYAIFELFAGCIASHQLRQFVQAKWSTWTVEIKFVCRIELEFCFRSAIDWNGWQNQKRCDECQWKRRQNQKIAHYQSTGSTTVVAK